MVKLEFFLQKTFCCSKELLKKSKDIARESASEDAIVRRSTRVRAPPKDNPSLAFLKYSNKWKVLMG